MTNLLVFFFFQAEDGIRDLYVTGVQTCALPIYFGKREPDDVRRLLAAGRFEDLAELARRVSSRILLVARLEILRPVVDVRRPVRDRIHVLVMLVVLEDLGREKALGALCALLVEHVAGLQTIGRGRTVAPGRVGAARAEHRQHRDRRDEELHSHDRPPLWAGRPRLLSRSTPGRQDIRAADASVDARHVAPSPGFPTPHLPPFPSAAARRPPATRPAIFRL